MIRTMDHSFLSGTHVLLLDVDADGMTADGERFDIEAVTYRDHARVENVVVRYPDGRLQLVQRVTPARHAV